MSFSTLKKTTLCLALAALWGYTAASLWGKIYQISLLSITGAAYLLLFSVLFGFLLWNFINSQPTRTRDLGILAALTLVFTGMVFFLIRPVIISAYHKQTLFYTLIFSLTAGILFWVAVGTVIRRKPATSPAWIRFLVGGLLFLAIFQLAYLKIDPHDYLYRDDGIITLSHAKNLVEYGSIGVNPAGERVEGFSTPAQFIIFLAAYLIGRVDYTVYSNVQTLVCTFLLGGIFLLFFEDLFQGLLVGLLAAAALAFDPSFIEWHASGMENPLVHVLFLAALLVLWQMLARGRIHYGWTLLIFFAAIARIESVYYIFPLLALFAIFWRQRKHNWQGLAFAGIVAAIWIAFMAGRWTYFGHIFPNTADAQGISPFSRLLSLLQNPSAVEWTAVASIFKMHFGLILPIGLVLIWLDKNWKQRLFLYCSIAMFVLLGLINPLVFSQSRIDPTRTTTFIALMTALLVGIGITSACRIPLAKYAAGVCLVIALPILASGYHKPYYLGWSPDGFLAVRAQVLQFARSNDLPRPTLANPDLGVISWHKDFNVIDMAFLGNPVTAGLRMDQPSMANYFINYAAPDVIELHEAMFCEYGFIYQNPKFSEMYTPLDPSPTSDTKNCNHMPGGIYIRKDILKGSPSAERRFIDIMQQNPSLEAVQAELALCSQSGSPTGCAYVTRTVYRFLPEIRAKGLFPQVQAAFSQSPSAEYDRAILNAANDGRWSEKVIQYLKTH